MVVRCDIFENFRNGEVRISKSMAWEMEIELRCRGA